MQKHLEQRAIIKFHAAQKKTAIQTWRELQQVHGTDCMYQASVRCWMRRFKADPAAAVTDKERSGRPHSTRTEQCQNLIMALLKEDIRRTIDELSNLSQLSVGSVYWLLQELELCRINAKFIPKILKPSEAQFRVTLCQMNLDMLRHHPNLLEKVICTDESWVHVYSPELKSRSSQWLPKGSRRPQKALRSRSAKKTLLTVFYDWHGIIYFEFTDHTVSAEDYIATLSRFRERVRLYRPELWESGDWYLQQDNAPAHTAILTIAYFGEHDMDLLNHPPYSPDLAPCDYFMFPALKATLRGRRFENVDALQNAVKQELCKMSRDKIRSSIMAMETRWKKCISVQGQYFEGQGIPVQPEEPLVTDTESDTEPEAGESSEEPDDDDDDDQHY